MSLYDLHIFTGIVGLSFVVLTFFIGISNIKNKLIIHKIFAFFAIFFIIVHFLLFLYFRFFD